MMKSTKPTINKEKVIADALKSFERQIRRMKKKNDEFWKTIGELPSTPIVDNVTSYKMKLKDDSVSLIVTSPPYVTSYEYADLHQLTAIWLFGFHNLSEFRSKFNFIGSVVSKKSISIDLYSNLGRQTVAELEQIDKREANGVLNYFYEMQLSFQEMYRVLKQGGIAAIVIGNTELKRVKIRNVNVFKQTMEKIGFKFYKTIKWPIPNKILPSTRDKKTGRFAATVEADRLAYKFEYILMMEKRGSVNLGKIYHTSQGNLHYICLSTNRG